MSSNLSVKKNGSTRTYVGGELLYLDTAKTKQVKELYVKKNNVTKMVWQYDITAPSLYCNQATGAIYYRNSSSFTITGTVSDTESGVKSVTVNGSAVSISNNSWSRTISLSTGSQTHTIIAEDNAGNKSYAYVKTYYDTTAPSINITSSLANRNSSGYTLTGTISDSQSGLASASVNGTSVGSSFSLYYTLGEGITTFTITATDKCGNTATKTCTVTYVNTNNPAPISYVQSRHDYQGTAWQDATGTLDSSGWYTKSYSDSAGPFSYGATARSHTTMQAAFRHRPGVKYMYSGYWCQQREATWRLVTDAGAVVASSSKTGTNGQESFTVTVPDDYVQRSDLYLYVFCWTFAESYAGSGYTANSSAKCGIKRCTQGI